MANVTFVYTNKGSEAGGATRVTALVKISAGWDVKVSRDAARVFREQGGS